jgi:hypothetical protein
MRSAEKQTCEHSSMATTATELQSDSFWISIYVLHVSRHTHHDQTHKLSKRLIHIRSKIMRSNQILGFDEVNAYVFRVQIHGNGKTSLGQITQTRTVALLNTSVRVNLKKVYIWLDCIIYMAHIMTKIRNDACLVITAIRHGCSPISFLIHHSLIIPLYRNSFADNVVK